MLMTLSYITAWRGIEQGKLKGVFYQVGDLDMDFWAEESLKAQEEIPEDCYLVLADEGKNVSISVRAIELEEGSDLEDLEDLVKADGAVLTLVIPGDIDSDGQISASDARLVLRRAVSLENFSNWQEAAGLVNDAKTITAAEARLVLRAAVGLEVLK